MTSDLDPYSEYREWLSQGPTTWSDPSRDELIGRIAVTPQRRPSYGRWTPSPRRALYAVAGLAAAAIVVGVAWAVLSGQLLPTDLPPASTPEPSTLAQTGRSDGFAARLDDGRVLLVAGRFLGMGERVAASAHLWDPVSGSMTATGLPADPRVSPSATALSDGRVLVVGGFGGPYAYASSAIASAEVWDPATEAFTPAGSMSERRVGHTATLLPDGRVLVVGGEGSDGASASAEIWDPASNAFTRLALPAEASGTGTATLLGDGRVLIVRGTAVLWDPQTNAFSPSGSLAQARIGHTATLIQNGRVLIAGGRAPGGGFLASAELWDPTTGDFSATGSLAAGRAGHAATRLADGRVFFFGGYDDPSGPALATVEFWDPLDGSFGKAAALAEGLVEANTSAVLLSDGRRVLVAGYTGGTGGPASAFVYDPADGDEPTSPPQQTAQQTPEQTPEQTLVCHWDLPTDVLAEVELLAAELGVAIEGPDYVATSGDVRLGVDAFVQAGCDLIVARVVSPELQAAAAAALEAYPEQRAVVFGSASFQGWDLANVLWLSVSAEATGSAISDAIRQVVDGTFQGGTLSASGLATPPPPFTGGRPPTDGPFSPTGLLAQTDGRGRAVLLPDGRVLTLNRSLGMLGTLGYRVFDPVSGASELTGQPTVNRFESTATLLRDGRVLVIGGVLGRPDVAPEASLESAEIWDPATETFSSTGSMAEDRRNHTATLLADGRVLVVGGGQGGGIYMPTRSLVTAEIWDPATGRFSPTGSMAKARQLHSATLLADGRVLIVGGSIREEGQSENSVSSAEIWDPATGLFTRAGSFVSERNGHTATLLSDGSVLIVGGTSAEIWDPTTASFSSTGDPTRERNGHVAVLLIDGRVLIFGESTVEQWDPTNGTFSAAPAPAAPINPHSATVLEEGRVLLLGSTDLGGIAAVVYDPGGGQ